VNILNRVQPTIKLPSAPNTFGHASDHGAEIAQHSYTSLVLKQAMTASNIVPHPLEEPPRNDSNNVSETIVQETTAARIPERFASIIRDKTERAAMARPSKQYTQVIKDKSVIVLDCGALQTITNSLIDCKEVKEKVMMIETADGDERA
jgi:hypothetical protein